MTTLLWWIFGCGGAPACPESFRDADGDGFGNPFDSRGRSCADTAGWVTNGADCDDRSADLNPAVAETCNGLDDNCDGVVDPVLDLFFEDIDGDGFGGAEVRGCERFLPLGLPSTGGDCDDLDGLVHPGATEACNDLDDDCDGAVDGVDPVAGGGTVQWRDADGDGEGDPSIRALSCGTAAGWVPNFRDCDDGAAEAACPPFVPGLDRPLEAWPDRVTGPAGTFALGVVAAGDLDGDGVGDLAVRWDGADPQLSVFTGGWVGAIDAELDAYATFTEDLKSALVAGAGDVNGDGAADLAVGFDDGVLVFHGPLGPGAFAPSAAALTLAPSNVLWTTLARAGDIDDDGQAELWLLSLGGEAALKGASGAGTVPGDLAEATVQVGWAYAALESADLDGDGLAELVVGQQFADQGATDSGVVWVVAPPFVGDVDVEQAARATLAGGTAATRAGERLAAGADLDGDGGADLVIGAHAGWVAVVTDDPPGPSLAVEAPGTLFVSNGLNLPSVSAIEALSLPGDLDGDGAEDLAISAVLEHPVGSQGPAVLLVPGPLAAGTVDFGALSRWEGAPLGVPLSLAGGDFDGDGLGDFAAGAVDLGVLYLGSQ